MPELVHLNGPMGVGKSTLAAALATKRRLALNLDIDELRMRLGGWRGDPEAKPVARSLGLSLVATHLQDGYDVVLPQLLCNFDVIDEVEAIATTAGARYTEVVVVAALDEIVARLRVDRSSTSPHPRDNLTDDEFVQHVQYALDALRERAVARPSVQLVDVTGLDQIGAAAAVCAAVGW